MGVRQDVGRAGEQLVAAQLESQGWSVLDRNWRCTGGELDIVAMDGTTLVAVEVKTRRSSTFGHPAEAVTPTKLARLRRLTGQWLAAHDTRPTAVRVDVVAVSVAADGTATVEHLRAVV